MIVEPVNVSSLDATEIVMAPAKPFVFEKWVSWEPGECMNGRVTHVRTWTDDGETELVELHRGHILDVKDYTTVMIKMHADPNET